MIAARRNRFAVAAVLCAAALLAAACTDVPSSSAPQTIEPLTTGSSSPISSAPNLTGDERQVVQSFLVANASTTGTHPVAREYLSPTASKGWHDDTATIIADDEQVGTYNRANHTVTVSGRVLGTLNAAGVYTPSLQGDGEGGSRQSFVFGLKRTAKGLAQINALNYSGLLLTDSQFRQTYRQQVLYFYDRTDSVLVPDQRWSSLDDRAQLAEWLVGQLVAGPRDELDSAVSLDTFPAQFDTAALSVQLGAPTRVEIPGSRQLDAAVLTRLAAQLSHTLDSTLAGLTMSITDGGTPVSIPQLHTSEFSAADFPAALGPPVPASDVYYLQDGQIRDGGNGGRLLSGRANDGTVFLDSVAVGQPTAGGPLLIAGVAGTQAHARLEVGTQHGGLRPTSVVGAELSRPTFAPGRAEVWIGDGPRIYRVNVDGATPHVEQVQILTRGGQVVALRFSPDGARIAVVLSGAGGLKQLYIGSVVRGAGPARVDGLKQISPEDVVVQDVAWRDVFKLVAIGYLVGSQDWKMFDTGVDGVDWTNTPIGDLPAPARPDSVTAATDENAWVSANGFVWRQSGPNWLSPGPAGQTPGLAPVYLE